MKVDSSYTSLTYESISLGFNKRTEEKDSYDAKDISAYYLIEYQKLTMQETQKEAGKQSDIFTLADIGYNGKPIGDLTQNEAKKLVGDDGFFGIKATSQRIGNFVINGAGDSIEMLKAGRDGIITGFNEAQKIWGGDLPDISQETLKKALDMIDKRISELGGNVIDTQA